MTPRVVSFMRLSVSEAMGLLGARPAGIRCHELVRLLEGLGFNVQRRRSGGHHTFTHPDLRGFHGSNFNCGHRDTDFIKAGYIRKILRLLNEFQEQLE
jgi:predicted RNA binding protein YcfA (HicA-like mRNA interferase family)